MKSLSLMADRTIKAVLIAGLLAAVIMPVRSFKQTIIFLVAFGLVIGCLVVLKRAK
jgi:hypothetical protein